MANLNYLKQSAHLKAALAAQALLLSAHCAGDTARFPAHIRSLLEGVDLENELIGVKATDNDLKSYHKDNHGRHVNYGSSLFIGAPDYKADPSCGNGLHFCVGANAHSLNNTVIHPKNTKGYYHICAIPVHSNNAVIISGDSAADAKIKCGEARILFSGRGTDVLAILEVILQNKAQHRYQAELTGKGSTGTSVASAWSSFSTAVSRVCKRAY